MLSFKGSPYRMVPEVYHINPVLLIDMQYAHSPHFPPSHLSSFLLLFTFFLKKFFFINNNNNNNNNNSNNYYYYIDEKECLKQLNLR